MSAQSMFIPRKFRVYPQFGGQATIARRRRQRAETGESGTTNVPGSGYSSFPGLRPRRPAKGDAVPVDANASRSGDFVVMPKLFRKLISGLRRAFRASSAAV